MKRAGGLPFWQSVSFLKGVSVRKAYRAAMRKSCSHQRIARGDEDCPIALQTLALFVLSVLALGLLGFGSDPALRRETERGAIATVFSTKPGHEQSTAFNRRPAIEVAYGNLPLSFEPNEGQTNSQVEFLSRGRGYTLFLTATEAVLSLSSPQSSQRAQRANFPSASSAPSAVDDPNLQSAVVRMKLVGANPSPRITGLEELPGKSHYFIGNDPAKWRTNVPTYAKVKYEDVYPGVDLVYYGNQGQLEYDLIVAPGSDPGAIHLAFGGLDFGGGDELEIDVQGDLVLHAGGSQIRLQKPLVYQETGEIRQETDEIRQETDGIRQEIPAAYVLNARRQVGFEVGTYDADKPLIIDPVLSYSTYLGGTSVDRGFGIAVDGAGNTYVTGGTNSTDFPIANPFQAFSPGGLVDAFVTKLNATGSALVYSTYLGGAGNEQGFDIKVDDSGNAYVTGQTDSTDFPTAGPIQVVNRGLSDVFVTKLNAAGNDLVYSTYLGGSSSDFGFGIAVDDSGNAYVTGQADSTDFPTALPIQSANGALSDAFVAKLNAAGNVLRYSTYLGGNGNDCGFRIAVDDSGNAYVHGDTTSTNFPTANPVQSTRSGASDAFVTKLNESATALVYSTYLGGNGNELGFGIAVDASGNAYVTGLTNSTDFPTLNPFQAVFPGGAVDAFVTKLNAAGSALVYSTYLGGSGDDRGFDIAVDTSGNAHVTGRTDSTDFPTASPIQPANGDGDDAFVTKLNATGSALVYSTYLGGGGNDQGFGIAVDASDNAYVTGTSGSTDFPTANASQPSNAGIENAFIAKITELPLVAPTLPANSVVNGASFRPATDPNGAIAPGAIVAIFGTDLASDTLLAGGVPLPTTLGETSVTFDDVAAPLFFVSGTQINAQVPFELMAGAGRVTVQVKRGSEASAAQPIALAAVSPGIFTLNQQGTGPGAILHAEDFQPVSETAPARPGEFLLIFCTGLGPVQPEVQSGEVAPNIPPLAETISRPLVNIAGIAAAVTFSGLAPGFVGLYQMNVQVPAGVPSGTQSVEIIINNVPGSAEVTIAVE